MTKDHNLSVMSSEYRITTRSSTLVNPTSIALLERIHQFLGNLLRTNNIRETYVEKDDPWSGILAATTLYNLSTEYILKGYILDHLVFGRDMIIPIKHTVYWELIRQKNKTKINTDNIRGNSKRA